MTNAEALQAVEYLCDEWDVVYKMDLGNGEPYPEEKMAFLAHALGDDWDRNLEDFCMRKITPEQYVQTAAKLLDGRKKENYIYKLEKKITALRYRA